MRELAIPEGSRSASRRVAKRRRLRAAATVGAWFLGSRAWFWLVAWAALHWLPHAYVVAPPGYLIPWALPSWLRAWANWDGYWYLSIARDGYAGRPMATAFFPLYPLLLRAVGGSVAAAVAVSQGAFLAALGLLWTLAAPWGEATAQWAVAAAAFFPTAFYFSAVYPESLFLALSLGAVVAASRGRWPWAGVLGGLAAATSVYGVLLVPALFWYGWSRGPRWRWPLLWLGLIPLGLLAYMAYLGAEFGHLLLFLSVQAIWGRHLAPIWVGLSEGWRAFVATLGSISWDGLFGPGWPSVTPSNLWNFALTAWAVVGLGLGLFRIPGPWLLYGALVLIVPLSDPAAGLPLMSLPRLVLAAFPIFLGFGGAMAKVPEFRRLYFWFSLPTGALLAALFATGHWVA